MRGVGPRSAGSNVAAASPEAAVRKLRRRMTLPRVPVPSAWLVSGFEKLGSAHPLRNFNDRASRKRHRESGHARKAGAFFQKKKAPQSLTGCEAFLYVNGPERS